jgi:hypothetical protein
MTRPKPPVSLRFCAYCAPKIASLIEPVLALDLFGQLRKFGAGVDVMPPVGAQKAMRVGTRPARERMDR